MFGSFCSAITIGIRHTRLALKNEKPECKYLYNLNETKSWNYKNKNFSSEDYYRMKLQWKSISDEQKLKFTLMKERENLIGEFKQ